MRLRCSLLAATVLAIATAPAAATPLSPTPALNDPVLYWNSQLLDAIRLSATPPPKATRAMAIMHTAVFDALNAANGSAYQGYAYNGGVSGPVASEVAASVAAHRALTELFPARATELNAALASYLSGQPDTPATANGAALGLAAASAVLAKRATDNSSTAYTYTGGSGPGQWQPTPPAFLDPALPGWGEVTPWAMSSGDQYRPGPAPELTSQAYADAVNQVRELGSATSATRTADQTDIAIFWADGGGSATPPGHWLQIAQNIAEGRGQDTMDNARMFALLSMSVADAAITAWNTKYEYNVWRPIDAIRQGDTDGNPLTGDDDFWTPLLTTPNHPSYVSGHSTFSGASASLLASFFGTDSMSFCADDEVRPGISRCFDSLWAAAQEGGMSRIYGGIHYMFDNVMGLSAGIDVAQNVFATQLRRVPEPASMALFGLGLAGLAAVRRRLA